ncbi:potassium voltage-gated channel subfamily E member 3 [Hemicordylus capensis]|uniref:potassium voltage-gated channel subfamily E member 3 n=1 Tax=Hemicordylus capensis TaxID=884348 RepID=UPI002302C8D7|nr:potassium voltage-gated channel subfamily E member 3 [Hemicordylus capensis]
MLLTSCKKLAETEAATRRRSPPPLSEGSPPAAQPSVGGVGRRSQPVPALSPPPWEACSGLQPASPAPGSPIAAAAAAAPVRGAVAAAAAVRVVGALGLRVPGGACLPAPRRNGPPPPGGGTDTGTAAAEPRRDGGAPGEQQQQGRVSWDLTVAAGMANVTESWLLLRARFDAMLKTLNQTLCRMDLCPQGAQQEDLEEGESYAYLYILFVMILFAVTVGSLIFGYTRSRKEEDQLSDPYHMYIKSRVSMI